MMKIAVTGVDQTIRRFTEYSNVIKSHIESELDDLANEIKDESIKRAPFETGALENSHEVIRSDDTWDITFGPVFDEKGEDYTLRMHEGIGEGLKYNLGPKSREKNTGTPHRGSGVGWKFLERAAEHLFRGVLKRLIEAISRVRM